MAWIGFVKKDETWLNLLSVMWKERQVSLQGDYMQTVKRVIDNKRRYAPERGACRRFAVKDSKGGIPLAHEFAKQSVILLYALHTFVCVDVKCRCHQAIVKYV